MRLQSPFVRHSRAATALRLLGLFLFAGTALLQAHDAGLSTSQLHRHADRLEVELALAPNDLRALLPPSALPPDALDSAQAFAAGEPSILELAPLLCRVQSGGVTLRPTSVTAALSPGDKVALSFVYPYSLSDYGSYTFTGFASLPAAHRNYATVQNAAGLRVQEHMLQAESPSIELRAIAGDPAATMPPSSFSFGEFLILGLEHIWTGYDHLLFLFGLLLVCRSLRSVAAIISCFTLAHSLTLAVATLGWIHLTARFVEPAIAASIVFVGVENLLRGGNEPRWRWALTFAFGLIHGFGFASVLRELGVGADGRGIVAPLFTFNLGVELGQLVIAALVLPLLQSLRRHSFFLRRGVPALSALVALLGTYWFVERALLGA